PAGVPSAWPATAWLPCGFTPFPRWMPPWPGGAMMRAPCPLPDAPLPDAPLPDAPLPDAQDERESQAFTRRGLSSAQLKLSGAPLTAAPTEPELLASIRCG